MSYYFSPHETVEDGLKRIAHEELDDTLKVLSDDQVDDHEKIHRVRKQCKKIRGLLRLTRTAFEETYDLENGWYRDAARPWSALRDTTALIETVDELAEDFEAQIQQEVVDSLRLAIVKHQQEVVAAHCDFDILRDEFRQRILQGKQRVDDWSLDVDGFQAIEGGLGNTYQRGCKAFKAAYRHPTAETFHQWRKRAKYHWYHLRLLQPSWPSSMQDLESQVHQLANILGTEHDLSNLRAAVLAKPKAMGIKRDRQWVIDLIDRRRLASQAAAKPLGKRIFCEKASRFTDRIGCYWQAWKQASAPDT